MINNPLMSHVYVAADTHCLYCMYVYVIEVHIIVWYKHLYNRNFPKLTHSSCDRTLENLFPCSSSPFSENFGCYLHLKFCLGRCIAWWATTVPGPAQQLPDPAGRPLAGPCLAGHPLLPLQATHAPQPELKGEFISILSREEPFFALTYHS